MFLWIFFPINSTYNANCLTLLFTMHLDINLNSSFWLTFSIDTNFLQFLKLQVHQNMSIYHYIHLILTFFSPKSRNMYDVVFKWHLKHLKIVFKGNNENRLHQNLIIKNLLLVHSLWHILNIFSLVLINLTQTDCCWDTMRTNQPTSAWG